MESVGCAECVGCVECVACVGGGAGFLECVEPALHGQGWPADLPYRPVRSLKFMHATMKREPSSIYRASHAICYSIMEMHLMDIGTFGEHKESIGIEVLRELTSLRSVSSVNARSQAAMFVKRKKHLYL